MFNVRSYRERLVSVHELTTGDDIALEKLDCDAAAIRRIMIRKPWRADALRDTLKRVEREAAAIVARYS